MRSGSSILVVDDDQDLVNLLERILKEEGYNITKAYDSGPALALADEHKPDLVILDILMLGLGGFKLIKSIRQRYDIPIIALAAGTDAAALRDAFNYGADDYMDRPFKRLELLARIKAKLRRS